MNDPIADNDSQEKTAPIAPDQAKPTAGAGRFFGGVLIGVAGLVLTPFTFGLSILVALVWAGIVCRNPDKRMLAMGVFVLFGLVLLLVGACYAILGSGIIAG